MASGSEASCANDPNFAIICSFFEKFSSMLNIQQPDIQLLQEWLENSDDVAPGLRDLHIKLLRKMRKTVHETAWETALAKFCYMYSAQDAWEIERFGYKKSSLKVKLRILTAIVEYQFQLNGKFRKKFENMTAEELRCEPIGRDRLGHSYWFTRDPSCNFRIYQEHLDEDIWQVVATNRAEMQTLISRLKGNEVVLPSLIGIIDEDSSSNSCANAIIKPPPPEEQDDSQTSSNGSNAKTKVPNIKIKIDNRTVSRNGDVVNGNSKEKSDDAADEDDEEGEDESEEEEAEEETEEESASEEDIAEENDEEEEKETQVMDEEKKAGRRKSTTKSPSKASTTENLTNGVPKAQVVENGDINFRKVEPIVISQSKIAAPNGDKPATKKRISEDEKSTEPDTEPPPKKVRPSILGNDRPKKSRYEKCSDEEDDKDEDETDESEGEEEEEVEDDDESDYEGEDDNEVEANGVADEKNDEKSDEKCQENNIEVSEAIEDELLVVKGEGSGKDCESSPYFFRDLYLGCETNEELVGEAIEEEVMYVYGEGNGTDCLVGNQHEEQKKSDTVVLNTVESNIKRAKSPETSKKNTNITNGETSNDETEKEKILKLEEDPINKNNNSEHLKSTTIDDAKANANEKSTETKLSTQENKAGKEDSPETEAVENESDEKVSVVNDVLDPETKEGIASIENISKKNDENICESAKNDLPINTSKKASSNEDPASSKKDPALSKEGPASSTNDRASSKEDPASPKEDPVLHQMAEISNIQSSHLGPPDENSNGNSRKRRLSEDKTSKNLSESESDLNSDSVAPPTEDDEDIGGKRLKMRAKTINAEVRKKVEEVRKSLETHESTSEEDTQLTGNEKLADDEASEQDPLQISDNDVLAAKSVDVDAAEIPSPTPALIKTRASKYTPAGATIKSVGSRGRGRRKPGRPPRCDKLSGIPSLDRAPSGDEDSKPEKPSVLEKMPKLEPETNGAPDDDEKTTPSQRKPRGRKRDIDTSNIIDPQADTPVRQSRRIAQLKIREEAERRKMEEEALKKMKAEFKKKKKEEKISQGMPEISESSAKSEEDSESEAGKKFAKKKPGRVWKKDGWSSGPEDEAEDEDDDLPHDRYDSDRGSPLFKSDHEFSPESDIEDESQVVPLKRARTAKKEGADSGDENLDESCQKCGKKDHPEWILLCDKCDKGYHCSCLSPVLFIIPEGNWFCPPCQQEQLITALEKQVVDLDTMVEQKRLREEEERKLEIEQKLKEDEEQAKVKEETGETKEVVSIAKKSRAERAKRRSNPKSRKAFVVDDDEDTEDSEDAETTDSESSSNGTESRTKTTSKTSDSDDSDEPIYKLRKRRQVNVSYRLNEYEDLINSAIKEEMDELAGAGNLGRGKDISTIIEADKEEKLRQRQLGASNLVDDVPLENVEVKEDIGNGDLVKTEMKRESTGKEIQTERVKKSKSFSKNMRKKGRKLNNLDFTSDDDGSDEDFKTSSYETEEEDESISEPTDSDSSLEVYKKRSKKNKKKNKKEKHRRPQRRMAGQRRRLDDFIVEDSEFSDEGPPKQRKVKRKHNWEELDTESEEELSEQIDSDELCDDSSESEDSDGCWRPSKRKKGKSKGHKARSGKGLGPRGGKQPRKFNRKDSGERVFKSKAKTKAKYDSDSDDVPRTRGKRFTYLDSFSEESSDDGIKPGVKRPDTPPEEREKFIKKQEEIKRMLAEKNTEAAKAVATPTLDPVDSLSTVPLSVIKGAKALDIDYLHRKGELNSEEGDTDFDEDLPDDFDPEAMDEEEIAKMMEEEDFAQQQLKVSSDVPRQTQKKKELEMQALFETRLEATLPAPITKELHVSQLQEPPRKRLPIPTIHPPLSSAQRYLPPNHRVPFNPHARQGLAPSVPLSMHPGGLRPAGPPGRQMLPGLPPPLANVGPASDSLANEQKPRGRRKKITPLRDTLQKQQAAAAAAAAAGTSTPGANAISGPGVALLAGKEVATALSSEKVTAVGPTQLSVAQPPQLYTPTTSMPPSVITRMPQQPPPVSQMAQPALLQQVHRPPRPPFSDQNARFYPPPNQMPPHRMSIIRSGAPMPHHTLGPSFVGGPPPLRPASPGMPVTGGSGVSRQPTPRPLNAFSPNDAYGNARPPRPNPPHAYRPPLYGSPGYPPAPPQQSQTPIHPTGPDYNAVASSYGPALPYGGPYYPPPQNIGPPHATPPQNIVPTHSTAPQILPSHSASAPAIGPTHSTPPPPTASAVPVITVVAPSLSAPNAVTSVPAAVPLVPTPPLSAAVPATSVSEAIATHPQPERPKASVFETFDSKSRSPILEAEGGQNSPYSSSAMPDDRDEDNNVTRSLSSSTSEFSGLVSYFSSQQDDLNS